MYYVGRIKSKRYC